ncbi:uncharacterized protein MONBRDRAFT_31463 [Monosiga brevicollis MX1]|uniref:Fanconi-associated nuclease n=1 Tax=Monosiga brevicollis TaxID=81824 RepID=A9UTB9_MONBE|nr:uncharacterized protein MONBRDRAFT_31463 [Monosiga brevicollis MX1]EDQ91465.1 predicted protein [Monosiga brevicollis MX1]|eukprot:XP_001743887.1 hypothetical protein [Monosiga brevicollis MX1]
MAQRPHGLKLSRGQRRAEPHGGVGGPPLTVRDQEPILIVDEDEDGGDDAGSAGGLGGSTAMARARAKRPAAMQAARRGPGVSEPPPQRSRSAPSSQSAHGSLPRPTPVQAATSLTHIPTPSSGTAATITTTPLRRRRASVAEMLRSKERPGRLPACPSCGVHMHLTALHRHLDACLSKHATPPRPATPPPSATPINWAPQTILYSPDTCARLTRQRPPLAACLTPQRLDFATEDREPATTPDSSASQEIRQPPASPSELAERASACFLCGEPTHFARVCPQGPYYVYYFCREVSAVLQHSYFCTLFTPAERAQLEAICALPRPELCLLVRLYNRSPRWFAATTLRYPEIAEDVQPILARLVQAGAMIDAQHLDDPQAALELLNAQQLIELRRRLHLDKVDLGTGRRDVMTNLLRAAAAQSTLAGPAGPALVLRRAKRLLGSCYALEPRVRQLLELCTILFHHKTHWSDAGPYVQMQADRGVCRYPAYIITTTKPAFASRSQLEDYGQALALERQLERTWERFDSAAVLQHLAPTVAALERCLATRLLSDEAAATVHTRFEPGCMHCIAQPASGIFSHLFMSGCLPALHGNSASVAAGKAASPAAMAIGPSRTVLSLLRRATRLCKHKEHESLHKHLSKLPDIALNLGETLVIHGQAMSDREVGRRMNFLYNHQACSVEDLVLLHAAERGWKGSHCEGRYLAMLFTLLLWDLLFSAQPDVFVTPYQIAPLDLHSDGFYARRATALRLRLSQLSYADLGHELTKAWNEHHGTTAVGVHWDLMSLSELVESARCIGNEVVCRMLDLLAQDYRHRTGGLPDLLLWRAEYDADGHLTSGQARFVEVKSPNDRLSDKQQIWLHVLQEVGAAAGVCHVKVTGAKAEQLAPPSSPSSS